MPFTVSHTIAAVPLRRLLGKRAVVSALVIGTVVPDYRHFLPELSDLGTHSLAALIWFALPVGVATYLLFHAWLEEPALALLPLSVRRRLGRFISPAAPSPGAPLAAVALCVIVGAATHIAWDHLTQRIFSGKLLWHRGRQYIYVYDVLQQGSSLVGLALLVVWCRRWLAAQPVDEKIGPGCSPSERALGLTLVVAAPTVAVTAGVVTALRGRHSVTTAIELGARAGGMVFAVGVLLFALAWRLRGRDVPE